MTADEASTTGNKNAALAEIDFHHSCQSFSNTKVLSARCNMKRSFELNSDGSAIMTRSLRYENRFTFAVRQFLK
jgi:hypothetical protein